MIEFKCAASLDLVSSQPEPTPAQTPWTSPPSERYCLGATCQPGSPSLHGVDDFSGFLQRSCFSWCFCFKCEQNLFVPLETTEPGSSDWVEPVEELFTLKETEILSHHLVGGCCGFLKLKPFLPWAPISKAIFLDPGYSGSKRPWLNDPHSAQKARHSVSSVSPLPWEITGDSGRKKPGMWLGVSWGAC